MGFMFDHVLAYITNPLYPYPSKHYDELDFYDIQYNKNKLYNQLNVIENITRNIYSDTKHQTFQCYKCDSDAITYTISCFYHKNDIICRFPNDCNNTSKKYNYCDLHCNYDIQNKNILRCKKGNCSLSRIKNQYYCFRHMHLEGR
jgi:hypothetical protein